MPEEGVLCYNRGCGKLFKPENNTKNSCTFHPGSPVFHDAYKGWSCCKKKCTDFTEFLNIKGCTHSFHSNEKPPEPVKPPGEKEQPTEVVEMRPPQEAIPRLQRPPYDTPLTTMKPTVASSLISQLESLILKKTSDCTVQAVAIGTSCKHSGCKASYEGPTANHGSCIHHPGQPIFHEGLKFWSCCKKRTTDFAAFLEQVGCVSGEHQWIGEEGAEIKPACRHDWHQTGSHVIISVYAKKYDPNKSTVQLNPVRAKIDIYFPESGERFEMDTELRGIIDVAQSEVNMLGTKVEVKLKKAEPGSWHDLSAPMQAPAPAKTVPAVPETLGTKTEELDDEPVDLSDL